MIEQICAQRYKNDPTVKWDSIIQLVRSELKWNRKEGLQASGTWEGKMPESGIYLMQTSSNTMFYGKKDRTLGQMDWPMIFTFQSDGTWEAVDLWINLPFPGMVGANGGSDVETTEEVRRAALTTYNHFTKDRLTPVWAPSMSENHGAYQDATMGVEKTLATDDPKLGYATCFGGTWFTGKDAVNPTSINNNKVAVLDAQSVRGSGIIRAGALDNTTMALGQIKKSDGAQYWKIQVDDQTGFETASSWKVQNPINNISGVLGNQSRANTYNLEGSFMGGWNGQGSPVIQVRKTLPQITIDQALDPRIALRVFDNTLNPYTLQAFHVLEVDIYNQVTTLEEMSLS